MATLGELAKTVRSKNAGVDLVTFDIIFESSETYAAVVASRAVTPAGLRALYNLEEDELTDFVEFPPANAIKFTMRRLRPSGSPGDTDIFGSQQYAPLLSIVVPQARPIEEGER